MGLFKKLTKAAKGAVKTAVRTSINPVAAIAYAKDTTKKTLRAVDITARNSTIRSSARGVDRAVGGAKGWSTVTKVAAVAANAIPVYGQVASAALAATSVGLAAEAKRQADAKTQREAAAYQAQAVAAGVQEYTTGFVSGGSLPGAVAPAAGATVVGRKPESLRQWWTRVTSRGRA